MKTIFITITRGLIARNILRMGVLDKLLAHEDIKVILLVSPKVFPYFREEFSHPRVTVEHVSDIVYPRWRRFFIILFNGLTYTDLERRMLKYGGGGKGPKSSLGFWIRHITFSVISRIKILKRVARWLEQYVFIEKDLDYLFAKYNPQVVFCTSIYSKLDIKILKAAKRLGVGSISMPKSWDTVGRLFFRVLADVILVNNRVMKDWVMAEQLVPESRIHIFGLPQFDIYRQKQNHLSYQEFCRQTGIDAKKPTILFASEGRWTSWDDWYIDDFINNHKILEKYNLVLRPHPSDIEEKRFHRFKKCQGVYVDDEHMRVTGMFGDRWDPTYANMDWFAEVLRAASVIVTFMSTVVLDAFANGKPVINLYYEPKDDPRVIPLSELYRSFHCQSVLMEKAAPLAASGQEVMAWLEKFIAKPELLTEARSRVIEKICYKLDGQSAHRIYEVIKQV